MKLTEIRRVLEVAASTRVLHARRARALEHAGDEALLGASFVTLRGLAEHCAAETDVPVRRSLDAAALARLVRHCASAASPDYAALFAERPGLARALAATLEDLRDAGVGPEALPDRVRDVRAVYAAAERALAGLARNGSYDRVGLFRLACRGAAGWARRVGFEAAELHGATELVGSAGDLLDALAAAVPLRMFQPDWGSPFAAELREGWPWRFAPEPVPVVDAPALERDAAALRVVRAPGPREELEWIAREILRLIEAGAKPSGIAVVARSLDLYAPWAETVFERFGLPFTSSLAESVLRRPAGRVWLDLVDVLFGNLEREALLRLLRSPRLASRRRESLPRLAEWLGRRAPVVGGAADWRFACRMTERLAEEEHRTVDPADPAELERLVARLEAARSRVTSARDFASCVEQLLAVADELLDRPADGPDEDVERRAREALRGAARLDGVDAALDRTEPPSREELRGALEEALRSATRRPHVEDEGGVKLLDALQARAVPVDHVFVAGLCHGSWPRERREDPFLPDSVRSHLRDQTGRPVPVAERVEEEERFLLGLLLAQTRASVTLSRPECNADGGTLAPSTLLRALPGPGRDRDVLGLERATDPPAELVTPGEALVDAALARAPGGPLDELETLVRAFAPQHEPALRAGIAHVDATEALDAADLGYDGLVPPDAFAQPESVSPTFLQTLGQCPQRGFFQRILRVRDPESIQPNALGANEAGSVVHRILAQIYARLFENGDLAPGASAAQARARAFAELPAALEAAAGELRERLRERHPVLWEALESRIFTATRDFLERDIEALLETGVTDLRAEGDFAVPIDTPAGALPLAGTTDRVVRLASGSLRVGDYKTGRDTRRFVREADVRRGAELQIPLYVLAAAADHGADDVVGEVLGVPLRPERDRRRRREQPRELHLARVQELLGPVLPTLRELLSGGRFPFHENDGCRYCPYTVACRKTHPQSEERVAEAGAFRGYFALHEAAR